MREPCGECKGCEHLTKRHEELHDTVREHATKIEAHGHKIDALRNANINTGNSIQGIEKTIKELTALYERQEQRLTDYEKQGAIQMQGIKDDIKDVKDSLLEALAPVKEMTDKNSSFIMKTVYMCSGGLALAYGAWWLHKNGFIFVALGGSNG